MEMTHGFVSDAREREHVNCMIAGCAHVATGDTSGRSFWSHYNAYYASQDTLAVVGHRAAIVEEERRAKRKREIFKYRVCVIF